MVRRAATRRATRRGSSSLPPAPRSRRSPRRSSGTSSPARSRATTPPSSGSPGARRSKPSTSQSGTLARTAIGYLASSANGAPTNSRPGAADTPATRASRPLVRPSASRSDSHEIAPRIAIGTSPSSGPNSANARAVPARSGDERFGRHRSGTRARTVVARQGVDPTSLRRRLRQCAAPPAGVARWPALPRPWRWRAGRRIDGRSSPATIAAAAVGIATLLVAIRRDPWPPRLVIVIVLLVGAAHVRATAAWDAIGAAPHGRLPRLGHGRRRPAAVPGGNANGARDRRANASSTGHEAAPSAYEWRRGPPAIGCSSAASATRSIRVVAYASPRSTSSAKLTLTWVAEVAPGGPLDQASNRVRDVLARGSRALPGRRRRPVPRSRARRRRRAAAGDDRSLPRQWALALDRRVRPERGVSSWRPPARSCGGCGRRCAGRSRWR